MSAIEHEKRWQSVETVAETLDISTQTVRRLVRLGQLQASKVGRQWRIGSGDLDAFLKPVPKQP